MAKQYDVKGTTLFQYEDILEFTEMLNKSQSKDFYFSFNPGIFGRAAILTVSFVDEKDIVHRFKKYDFRGNLKTELEPLTELMQKKGVCPTDGDVEIQSKSGDIYYIFSPNVTNEKNIQASYDAWLKSVKSLPSNETVIKYYTGHCLEGLESEGIVIDAAKGKEHRIMHLDGKEKRTLELTLNEMKGCSIKGSEPIENWYLCQRFYNIIG